MAPGTAVSGTPERYPKARTTTARLSSAVAETEDVLVRNYDFQCGYDLEVTVIGADGEAVHDERYYLQPGETGSEFGVLNSGEYEVHVVLDDRRETTARAGVIDPTDGVLVEVGNGAVSVHDGLYQ